MKPILLSLACVFVWACWPVLARKSGLTNQWINLIVTGITFLSVIIWFLITPKENLKFEQTKGISIMVLAGILNGIGMIMYGYLLEDRSSFQVSTYIPLISALMPLGTVIFSYILIKEEITLQKIIGTLMVFFGIFLITKK